MKNPIITLVCFLICSSISISSFAQEKKEFNTKKTEVNIGFSNIFAKNNFYYPYYYIDGDYFMPYVYGQLYRRPELVMGMKFHSKSGAYRLSTNLNYSSFTTKDNSGGSDNYKYNSFSSRLNMGYEWHTQYSRLVIYYGFDISASYSNNYYKSEYFNFNGPVINETTVNEVTAGINPLLGLNFFITPNLSIGTEVKFTAEYVSGKSEEESSGSTTPNETTSSGFRTHFGPLGFFSINLNF